MYVALRNQSILVPDKELWHSYYCKSYMQVKWTSEFVQQTDKECSVQLKMASAVSENPAPGMIEITQD